MNMPSIAKQYFWLEIMLHRFNEALQGKFNTIKELMSLLQSSGSAGSLLLLLEICVVYLLQVLQEKSWNSYEVFSIRNFEASCIR
jgi:hypothetical protein